MTPSDDDLATIDLGMTEIDRLLELRGTLGLKEQERIRQGLETLKAKVTNAGERLKSTFRRTADSLGRLNTGLLAETGENLLKNSDFCDFVPPAAPRDWTVFSIPTLTKDTVGLPDCAHCAVCLQCFFPNNPAGIYQDVAVCGEMMHTLAFWFKSNPGSVLFAQVRVIENDGAATTHVLSLNSDFIPANLWDRAPGLHADALRFETQPTTTSVRVRLEIDGSFGGLGMCFTNVILTRGQTAFQFRPQVTGEADLITGNTVWVDGAWGDDATGQRERLSRPFKTIPAALAAALAGDTTLLLPNTYNLAAGITIPSGVTLKGLSSFNTTIQMLGATVDTVLITFPASARLEDVTPKLTTTTDVNITTILYTGTSSATAKLRRTVVTADASAAPGAVAKNVFAVRSQSTGLPGRETSAVRATTLIARGVGAAKVRALLVDTNVQNFHTRDVNMLSAITAATTGTAIGAEVNQAGALLSMDSGAVNGTTADLSQTAGTLELGSCVLVNKAANGLAFKAVENSSVFFWGDDGALLGGVTRFMRPGTGTSSVAETKIKVNRPYVIKGLVVRAVIAPGAGKTDVFTLRKNGVDTVLTVSLSDANTYVENQTLSVDLEPGDDISLKAVSAIATGTTDVYVQVEMY